MQLHFISLKDKQCKDVLVNRFNNNRQLYNSLDSISPQRKRALALSLLTYYNKSNNTTPFATHCQQIDRKATTK